MSKVLIKLPCFVNMQHMWSLLNSNNSQKKFKKYEWTTGKVMFAAPNNDTHAGTHPH